MSALAPDRDPGEHAFVPRGVISLRVEPAERVAWQAAAKAAGLTLTEYIRRRVNGPTTLEAPPPVLKPKRRR